MKFKEVTLASLEHPEKGSYKIGPFGSSLKKDELVEAGIPVVGIENILPNEFVRQYRKFITDEKYEQLSRYSVQPGDVLITTMGTVGRAAVVPDDVGTMIYDSHLFRMRIDRRKITPVYLAYALNEYEGLKRQISQRARGAIMSGLNTTILKECTIPLPPLAEQQRIAAILDKADALRAKRRAALAKLDTLVQSTFLHMFGDPVTNPMGWPLQQFDNVGTLERGKSKHRPRNAPELLGGLHPLVQTGDVSNAEGGYLTTYTQTYSDIGLKQSRKWKAGVLCITIAANIANTAILTFDACFPDSVVGFLPNHLVRTEYVQYWLSFLQKNIEENAPQVAQKNINLKILRELEIPVPPINLQDDFVQIVKSQVDLRNGHKKHLDQSEHLFHALQQHAFNGELTKTRGKNDWTDYR